MTELILWALPAGETDRLYEKIMSSHCRTVHDCQRIKALAEKDGWHSFRITHLDLTGKPDFIGPLGA